MPVYIIMFRRDYLDSPVTHIAGHKTNKEEAADYCSRRNAETKGDIHYWYEESNPI